MSDESNKGRNPRTPMKKVPCSGPDCALRRVHYESDVPRGVRYVEVREDYNGKAYCSITCALMDGALKLRREGPDA